MDKKKERKRPGPKPRPHGEVAEVTSVRLTPGRREKLRKLGAAWLSEQIDKATIEPI